MEDRKMTLAEMTIQVARENLGKKEATGRNDGTFVQMIQDWMDGPFSRWMDRQPWCAAFATWCMYQAGKRLGITPKMPKNASSSSIYNWAKKNGALLSKPEGICIGLIKGSGGYVGKTHHHTFIANATVPVEGRPDLIWGIDGNWKNSVCRTQHAIAACDFVRIV